MFKSLHEKLNTNRGILLKNTIMLYLLQFSTYFFSLVTVPYQTRILGPSIYGMLGFAFSTMAYFQLFMDFGFLLSATADISLRRDDKEYISKKMTSITILKLIFIAVSLVIMVILCNKVNKFKQDPLLYYLFFAGTAVNALLPDYLYRGLENMAPITVRTLLIRIFSTVMIFVFLKDASDYHIVPLLSLIGNICAVIGVYLHIYKKLGLKFSRVNFSTLKKDFKCGLAIFYSRIATTVYTATNTLIVGFIDKTGLSTGYYTSADKVLQTAKNGLSPVSDSLYPYMVKHKDFKLVKKVLSIIMPIIIVGSVIVFIFAEPLCVFTFGKDFAGAAPILRALIPTIVIILPSYILGFPTLTAIGKIKHANISVIFGTVIHIIGIVVMLFTDNLSSFNLAIMVSISETSIMLYRLFIVIKNRELLKQ